MPYIVIIEGIIYTCVQEFKAMFKCIVLCAEFIFTNDDIKLSQGHLHLMTIMI